MNIINPKNYQTLIGIDEEVLDQLTAKARPFVDDPNAVLRRAFDLDRAADASPSGTTPTPHAPSSPPSPPPRPRSGRGSAGRSSGARPPRAPKGSLTPGDAFEQPILASLAEAGGALPFREARAAVGKRMAGTLNEHDRFTDERGVARWEKRVPFVRLRLVERGLLDPDAPRGVWQLTDAGRRALNGSAPAKAVEG